MGSGVKETRIDWSKVFLLSENNRDFVTGKSDTPILGAQKKIYQFAAYFFAMMAFPFSLIIIGLFGLASKQPITSILLETIVLAATITTLVTFFGYRMRQKLSNARTVRIGYVTGVTSSPSFGNRGYRQGTRLHYVFTNPQGERLERFVMVSDNTEAMKDGRPFPNVGKLLAILYADDNTHTLL